MAADLNVFRLTTSTEFPLERYHVLSGLSNRQNVLSETYGHMTAPGLNCEDEIRIEQEPSEVFSHSFHPFRLSNYIIIERLFPLSMSRSIYRTSPVGEYGT